MPTELVHKALGHVLMSKNDTLQQRPAVRTCEVVIGQQDVGKAAHATPLAGQCACAHRLRASLVAFTLRSDKKSTTTCHRRPQGACRYVPRDHSREDAARRMVVYAPVRVLLWRKKDDIFISLLQDGGSDPVRGKRIMTAQGSCSSRLFIN